MTDKIVKKTIKYRRLWVSMAILAAYAIIMVSSLLVMRNLLLKNAQKMGELMLKGYCNEERRYIYHGFDYTNLDKGNWPKDATYFLCDNNGTLLYYDSTSDRTYEEFQMSIDIIWEDLVAGKLEGYNVVIKDSDGNKRSIYYLQPENGIWAILTIPVENILEGMHAYYITMLVFFLVGAMIVIIIAIREYNNEKNNQRLRAERTEIAQSAHIYRKAIDSTAVSYCEIYYIDLKNDRYQMVYPDFAHKTEQRSFSEETRRRLVTGKIHSGNKEEVSYFLNINNIIKGLCDQKVLEIRYRRLDKNQKYEWCLTSITAADYFGGVPVSATMTIRSIEEMVHQEQKAKKLLTIAAQRAESANRAKSDFLSRMSHDIRTPMNAILGMTAIASMNIDNKDKVIEALDKISVSGRHLLGLINDILDMSRIESGKVNIVSEKFNLSNSIDELVLLFDEEIKAKKQNFNIKSLHIEHENVIGDKHKLHQIFVNILGNAVKFTPEGESISLSVDEKKSDTAGMGLYEFIFEDTGIGMEQDFVERIFEPFERAADSRSRSKEGTGLGMPIAVNFARMMGGDIHVESELNVGSRFTVTVYLKFSEDTEADSREDKDSTDAADEFTAYRNMDFTGRKILLVEDNEMNIEVMEEILGVVGIEITPALNGREALDILDEKPSGYFDMIFMDIRMPVMDGYEATKAIRNAGREDLNKIPIVAMSADAFEDDVKKAINAGMNAHVAKPVDIATLQKCLTKWIGE